MTGRSRARLSGTSRTTAAHSEIHLHIRFYEKERKKRKDSIGGGKDRLRSEKGNKLKIVEVQVSSCSAIRDFQDDGRALRDSPINKIL